MKGIQIFGFLALLFAGQAASADAGFSIRRQTAPAEIRFSGTGNIPGYQLVRVYYTYHMDDTLRKNLTIEFNDTIVEGDVIRVQNGGKRWDDFDREIRLALVKTDSSQQITDTFVVYLEKYNFRMEITGVKDGKLQYKMNKTKAIYEYGLLSGEGSRRYARLNRWIFIGCSLAGFILLTGMFLKRNKIKKN